MARALKVIVGILISVLALGVNTVPAQQANIDNGLAYLRSTQNPDGSWGGTATSLNTVLQTTATATRTLQLLGVADSSLTNALSFLSAQAPSTVDDLAQQLEVLAASGANVSSLVASVKSAQQADGGWGIDLEKTFPSEVVDTLSAVQALKVANALDSTIKAAMIGYLLGNQNPDGGWGITKGQPSEIFYTALVLLVLKDFQQAFNLSVPLTAGAQFLVAKQNPDGSFGSSVFETALVFQALVRYTLNPTSRNAAISYLTSTQLADGSWAEDAFSTALALRTLKDAQTISQAQIQAITLSKVVNGTRQPTTSYKAFETMAIGVSTANPNLVLEVIVQDSAGTVFSTRIEGTEFLFDTLNLPPGTYTVIARAIDPATGIIIDQQAVTFTIEATVAITNTVFAVAPRFTHVGATEAVTVTLSVTNRSNIAASLTIEHEVRSPSGVLISSGAAPLSISPETTSTGITLATFNYNFVESGDYPVLAKVFHGMDLLATATSIMTVAPDVRIDPSMTLTPQNVPPDADKRIRIDIHLEGVKQNP